MARILTIQSGTDLSGALRATPLPDCDTLVCMPATDQHQARQAATILAQRAGLSDLTIVIVMDVARLGFIACCNAVYSATRSRYFAYVAQDAFPGRAWLKTAVSALAKTGAGLLGFNDGKWAGSLAAFGLVKREWADTLYGGVLFHPAYARHYADAELTVLAMAEKRYAYDPHAMLIEVDYHKDTSMVEAADRQRYKDRASTKFDGRDIPAHLLNYIG